MPPTAQLERKIGLMQATAINMIDMVGIGPFVVMSLVAQAMPGTSFLYAWLAGAFLSFMDAMVWSEWGATFPLAGGSYQFLKAGYGNKAGKLMSFLFIWQTLIQAPLVIASAAIGFAQYFSFIVPLSALSSKMVSGGMVILIVILLYRKIETIGKISLLLWICVLLTLLIIIAGGVLYGDFTKPLRNMNEGLAFNKSFATALGFASVKTIYSFLGYYNVCHLGAEIKNPKKNIPRSMFISIAGIMVLYLLMNISIAAVLPHEQIVVSHFVVSDFVQAIAGPSAAVVVTVLVLIVAFSSVFSATLGYSRIPYAAAKDGAFFSVFSKLHPTKHFPYVSLLFLGSIAFVFSLLFKLQEVISAILAMRILVQFIGQSVGLMLLHSKKPKTFFGWRMPLYPLPVIITILIWLFIFYSTGSFMWLGISVLLVGVVVYFITAFIKKDWPFSALKIK